MTSTAFTISGFPEYAGWGDRNFLPGNLREAGGEVSQSVSESVGQLGTLVTDSALLTHSPAGSLSHQEVNQKVSRSEAASKSVGQSVSGSENCRQASDSVTHLPSDLLANSDPLTHSLSDSLPPYL